MSFAVYQEYDGKKVLYAAPCANSAMSIGLTLMVKSAFDTLISSDIGQQIVAQLGHIVVLCNIM